MKTLIAMLLITTVSFSNDLILDIEKFNSICTPNTEKCLNDIDFKMFTDVTLNRPVRHVTDLNAFVLYTALLKGITGLNQGDITEDKFEELVKDTSYEGIAFLYQTIKEQYVPTNESIGSEVSRAMLRRYMDSNSNHILELDDDILQILEYLGRIKIEQLFIDAGEYSAIGKLYLERVKLIETVTGTKIKNTFTAEEYISELKRLREYYGDVCIISKYDDGTTVFVTKSELYGLLDRWMHGLSI